MYIYNLFILILHTWYWYIYIYTILLILTYKTEKWCFLWYKNNPPNKFKNTKPRQQERVNLRRGRMGGGHGFSSALPETNSQEWPLKTGLVFAWNISSLPIPRPHIFIWWLRCPITSKTHSIWVPWNHSQVPWAMIPRECYILFKTWGMNWLQNDMAFSILGWIGSKTVEWRRWRATPVYYCCWWFKHPAVTSSYGKYTYQYLHGFIHLRWLAGFQHWRIIPWLVYKFLITMLIVFVP